MTPCSKVIDAVAIIISTETTDLALQKGVNKIIMDVRKLKTKSETERILEIQLLEWWDSILSVLNLFMLWNTGTEYEH